MAVPDFAHLSGGGMERIGVIGLGKMGAAIAQRYAAQDHPVQGWTRSGRGVDGVTCCTSVAELVGQSDTLILSFYDDAAVASVLDTLLQCDLDGRLVIETSTVVPTLLQDRAAQFAAAGALVVDAPISGGPELVAAGQCGVFIGGEDFAATRAMTVLAPLTSRLFHVGPLGAGLVMKTINNSMIQAYFGRLAEMLPLAARAGLPLETALKILCSGPAGMPMVADRLPKILCEDKTVGFTIQAANKDADVFRRVMESYGLTSALLPQSIARQQDAIDAGLGAADPAALIARAYRRD